MRILAVTSGKGGVGKSTITLNIARQLSVRRRRTLLVDFDIHNKGITGLFLPKIHGSSSVTSIVHESSGFSQGNDEEAAKKLQLVQLTSDGNLFLLPASRAQEMIQWSTFHSDNAVIVQFFRTLLQNLAEHFKFDAIVIDCYGGIDSLTVAAAGIADDTIIVNEPDLITFSGTLQLYVYLRKQYATAARQPRLHFVINRITSRHSFAFLDNEYRKHLATLAIDDRILAYFPYDKLLIETFGDYPFFTELLPKGLFTKKIRLLIESLWVDDPIYKDFSGLSGRKKVAVFQRTVENLFADPERILRATVTLPFWLIVPFAMLFALSRGVGGSLHYRTIQFAFYTAVVLLLFLALAIGFFEPVQISRWLWREATYHRRKRWLKKEKGSVYRGLVSAGQGLRAVLPAVAGLIFLAAASYYAWTEHRSINSLSIAIWPKEIYGFSRGGDYSGLRLKWGVKITKSDISHAKFVGANLSGVQFDRVVLNNTDFTKAILQGTQFNGSNLSEAVFTNASLYQAKFRESTDLTQAVFSGAYLNSATFAALKANNAKFSGPEDPHSYCVPEKARFLHPAELSGVHFDRVDLTGADFGGAHLVNATFQNSTLTNASFTCALLRNPRFENSIVTGAKFSDDFGMHDYATAQTLRQEGAQINVPDKPPPTPTLTGICNDADCEYLRATGRISDIMPDLVESLILKGGRQNWEAAAAGLTKIRSSPNFETNAQLQGQYLLLTLLLRLARGQPDRGAMHEWCNWTAKNRKLVGWQWNIWDHDVQRRHLSREVLSKIAVVEASAQGKDTGELCAKRSNK